ncbi:MAG: LysE family translocator [Cyclobacteriaceae bacterium]|nr:LysE family translocator [Cyclobacteriaceae bacterium]
MIVLNGIKFGLILALLIGPVFFTIIQTSIERGFWNGALVAVGVSLSDIFYVAICYLGMAQVLEDGQFRMYLAYTGGTILILLGLYHLLVKSRRGIRRQIEAANEKGVFRYIFKGFVINGLSPMVPIFWIGAISIASLDFGYSGAGTLIVFLASLLITVLVTDVAKAYLADKLRSMVTPRFMTIMNVTLGILLIVFGGRLVMIAQTFTGELVL